MTHSSFSSTTAFVPTYLPGDGLDMKSKLSTLGILRARSWSITLDKLHLHRHKNQLWLFFLYYYILYFSCLWAEVEPSDLCCNLIETSPVLAAEALLPKPGKVRGESKIWRKSQENFCPCVFGDSDQTVPEQMLPTFSIWSLQLLFS